MESMRNVLKPLLVTLLAIVVSVHGYLFAGPEKAAQHPLLVQPFMDLMDQSGDGIVDHDEFKVVAAPGAGFTRHDIDNNGGIDLFELELALMLSSASSGDADTTVVIEP